MKKFETSRLDLLAVLHAMPIKDRNRYPGRKMADAIVFDANLQEENK